jgi:hypothetical protein
MVVRPYEAGGEARVAGHLPLASRRNAHGAAVDFSGSHSDGNVQIFLGAVCAVLC